MKILIGIILFIAIIGWTTNNNTTSTNLIILLVLGIISLIIYGLKKLFK